MTFRCLAACCWFSLLFPNSVFACSLTFEFYNLSGRIVRPDAEMARVILNSKNSGVQTTQAINIGARSEVPCGEQELMITYGNESTVMRLSMPENSDRYIKHLTLLDTRNFHSEVLKTPSVAGTISARYRSRNSQLSVRLMPLLDGMHNGIDIPVSSDGSFSADYVWFGIYYAVLMRDMEVIANAGKVHVLGPTTIEF